MVAKPALVSVLLLALGAVLFLGRTALPADEFSDFVEKHHKSYASEDEYAYRESVYYANAAKVAAHNAKQLPWQLTLNEFADLTAEEFKAQRTMKYRPSEPQLPLGLPTDDLPPSVDWRVQGAVTAVKNQGVCGSCWSFSTTGSIEGAHFLATGELVSLSEQQLINCSFGLKYDNFACLGGQMNRAFQYVIDAGGLEAEAEYPYNPYLDLLCHASTSKYVASISSFATVQTGSQLQLKAAVAQQPVSVAVEADQDSWQLYKGGVITSDCGQNLDHGVLVVGYGTDGGVDYWIVKNSWGDSWGENGFLRILRDDTDTTGGLCGIAQDASYPIV